MKTVSMPLATYQEDLQNEKCKGFTEAMRRFLLILELSKIDPNEAIVMIVEDFEDDQIGCDKMLNGLGLMETAKKNWST